MSGEDPRVFQQVLGHGGPAFVRRGKAVELAFEAQVEVCRAKREEWLEFVRLPLGTLFALAGSEAALGRFLDNPKQLSTLQQLRSELRPQLRLPPSPTASRRVLRRALEEVRAALERFNKHWQAFIYTLDLREVNDVRSRYNRFYLLEKECALGSLRLVRHGFQRLNPLQPEDFLRVLPLLEVV
jgi:hypothetical protein